MPLKHKSAELRSIRCTEFRAVTDSDGNRSLEGMIPYNSRSVDLGGFVEEIAPGAFASALQAGADVLALRDHKQELLLARTKSGTLTLSDSVDGLRWKAQLPKTQQAEDLAISVERGDLDTNSFGFICNPNGDQWSRQGDSTVRTLLSVELLEISPCSFAAYPASTAALRSCPPELRSSIHLEGESSISVDARNVSDPALLEKAIIDALTIKGLRTASECRCTCDGCAAGNCEDCSIVGCDLESCDCDGEGTVGDDDDVDEWRERTLQELEIRKRLIPNRT